jgi:polyphosphate kinase
VPLEQVIAEHLGALFPGMEVSSHEAFRVTRNADLTLEEEEADDLLAAVEVELRRRRFGRAVRLETSSSIDPETLDLLLRELDLEAADVYRSESPLDLGGLWDVWALPRPDLKDEPHTSVTPVSLAGTGDETPNLFARIRRGDVLLHHPYDSFTTSVTAFIRQAATDPKVLAIKQTLYRTSSDSPIVARPHPRRRARHPGGGPRRGEGPLRRAGQRHLGPGAGAGRRARRLRPRRAEDALEDGARGAPGGRGHPPLLPRRHRQLQRAHRPPLRGRRPPDLRPEIGADLTQLFNYLTGYGRQERFRKLMVAPGQLRPRLADLIAQEASMPAGTGRITMKMNSLVDVEMIDALYAASEGGVEIDLIIRGICCLRPGVPGLSDRIRVRSIVGRFLEHSRLFHFANGGGPGRPGYWFGSADLMPRNLDRRVEAVVPVSQPHLQARVRQVLDVALSDDELAWELLPDGAWRKVPTTVGVNSHVTLARLARERARTHTSEPGGDAKDLRGSAW